MMNRKQHSENVYLTKGPERSQLVSGQAHDVVAVARHGRDGDSRVIDIGGGDSHLVDGWSIAV